MFMSKCFGLQVMKYVEYDNMYYDDTLAMQNGSTTILTPYAGACFTYNYFQKYWKSKILQMIKVHNKF